MSGAEEELLLAQTWTREASVGYTKTLQKASLGFLHCSEMRMWPVLPASRLPSVAALP